MKNGFVKSSPVFFKATITTLSHCAKFLYFYKLSTNDWDKLHLCNAILWIIMFTLLNWLC